MSVRLSLTAAAASALTLAAIALSPATATSVSKGATAYAPGVGFSETVGTKQVVGVFAPKDGACAVTLVVNALVDEETVDGIGTAIRVTLSPGATTEVDSGEGAALAVACQPNGDAITVAPQTRGGA